MAGVSTGANGGRRRSVDQEINMVPFIDLLMVTVSFLLITAVWTAMGGLRASAHAPSEKGPIATKEPDPTVLQVHVKGDAVALEWQKGTHVDAIETVPLASERGLSQAVAKAYQVGLATGRLATSSAARPNAAILHVPAALPMSEIVRVLDAMNAVRDEHGPAFAVSFSST